MPNWCYANVSFYGRRENVYKLVDDIESTMRYEKVNGSRCNMWFFLEKTGFDPKAYLDNECERYKRSIKERDPSIDDKALSVMNHIHSTNFRAYFCDLPYVYFDKCGIAACTVSIDSAWNTDTTLLNLISIKYDVLYTYTAEEEGMGLYYSSYNGLLRPDEDDTVIHGIYSSKEDEYESPIYCSSADVDKVTKELEEDGYDEYFIDVVDCENSSLPEFGVLGMYYYDPKLIPGMTYDIEIS